MSLNKPPSKSEICKRPSRMEERLISNKKPVHKKEKLFIHEIGHKSFGEKYMLNKFFGLIRRLE